MKIKWKCDIYYENWAINGDGDGKAVVCLKIVDINMGIKEGGRWW